jgi:hypothetical protein
MAKRQIRLLELGRPNTHTVPTILAAPSWSNRPGGA